MRSFQHHAALAVAILLSFPCIASGQQLASSANFAGVWQGKLTLDGLSHSVTLLFASRDSTVSGTFSDECWVVRDHVCVDAESHEIDRARVSGDTLTFVVERLEFSGVRKGSTLRLSLLNPYDRSKHTFIALKQQRSPP